MWWCDEIKGCRHHGLIADEIRLHLRTEGSDAVLEIEERAPLGESREFCLVHVLRNKIAEVRKA